MKDIIITGEQRDLTPIRILVRDKDYTSLKKMQYSGGFKRFSLSVYAEGIKGTYKDHVVLGDWLSKVFAGKPQINK